MALALHDIKPGDYVVIIARDEFYAFVDGWRGRVAGFNSGLAVVECQSREQVDGRDTLVTKTFYVPADQLGFDLLGGP